MCLVVLVQATGDETPTGREAICGFQTIGSFSTGRDRPQSVSQPLQTSVVRG